jgi:hypothetical protein
MCLTFFISGGESQGSTLGPIFSVFFLNQVHTTILIIFYSILSATWERIVLYLVCFSPFLKIFLYFW